MNKMSWMSIGIFVLSTVTNLTLNNEQLNWILSFPHETVG